MNGRMVDKEDSFKKKNWNRDNQWEKNKLCKKKIIDWNIYMGKEKMMKSAINMFIDKDRIRWAYRKRWKMLL